MTPSPAMTWLHLLPCDATCAIAPPEMRPAIEQYLHGGSRRLAAVSGGECSDELLGADGVVAINGRGFSAARFERAEFAYVRRLAVLPSLAQARWFIPLDSPAISAGALRLHTPTRWSASMKHLAARAAMHARLPIWYRDSLWIALREPPPIEVAVQRAIGSSGLRLALSGGAPEPARNRKATVAALAPDGRVLAFGKIAASPLARRLVRQEAAVLAHLAEVAPGCGPRLLSCEEVDGLDVVLQAPLNGRPAPARLTESHRRFLRWLRLGENLCAVESQTICELRDRLAALDDERLHAAFESVVPALQDMRVPVTVVHGDFAPWNLRQEGERLRAFDWEYGQARGLPLLDEVHFGLQVGYQLRGWSPAEGVAWLRVMRTECEFGAEAAEALQIVYLLDQISRLLSEGYGADDDMVRWQLAVLEAVLSCAGVAR